MLKCTYGILRTAQLWRPVTKNQNRFGKQINQAPYKGILYVCEVLTSMQKTIIIRY